MIINTKADLCREVLKISENELDKVIADLGGYYGFIRQKKYVNGKRRLNKDGTPRDRIRNPSYYPLCKIQGLLNAFFLKNILLPGYIYGGITERNNLIHASVHKGNKYKFKTDIQDFYSYVTCNMLKMKLIEVGFTNEVAKIITRLTTYNGHLPQGASTSVYLANLIFTNVGDVIKKFADENSLIFTSYIDDIVLSSRTDFKPLTLEVLDMIRERGFRINHKKTFYKTAPMEITGATVGNNYLSQTKTFREKLESLDTKTPNQVTGLLAYKKHIHKISPKYI